MEWVSSAPGRICLFGEHQDYLGLDIIAGAINLRFKIYCVPRKDELYYLKMTDIDQEMKFIPSKEIEYNNKRDYLKAAVNILKREYGFDFRKGYDFVFKSEIPINAGTASSSVMLVAWTSLLLHLHNHADAEDPEKTAYLAYKSEVLEFEESGGMMDHYTSSLGGVIHLETKSDPVKYERLYPHLKGFVLADSKQPKDTVGTLKDSKQSALKSIEMIKQYVPDFSFQKYSVDDIKNDLKKLPEELKIKLKANIINHKLTVEALKLLRNKKVDEKKLGELLDEHHRQLRDGLNISTPKIESMLHAAKKTGALGGKINGSGGGGTMFVYAPGNEHKVAKAISETGGTPYIIDIDKGISFEEIK